MPRQNSIPIIASDVEQVHSKNFVAIDGESIDGKYVLLGTSHPSYSLEDREGIKTDDALAFLFSLGHNRHLRAAHTSFVGFFFSYDVEMILKDLPDKIKRRVFNPRMILTKAKGFRKDRVFYKDWEITYIKRKYFSVKRRGKNHGITIYDVSGFFTGFPERSFIAVCRQLGIEVPQEIIEGKADRSAFLWDNYEKIREYNRIECDILANQMMRRIYNMCVSQDLVPRHWYGSSAVGNFALRKWNIRDYMRRTVQQNMSGYFWDAITRAYFGGRIEAFKLGTMRKIYAYDINSAYPWAITNLPSTRENHFVYTQKYRRTFAIWHIRYKFLKNIHIGIFPFRLADGSIKFPLSGEGWYWNPEVDLAIKHWPNCVDVIEGYYIQDPKKETPFKTLFPKLYEMRRQLKKAGNDNHYIIKIVLNSIYGKFAQKVGRADFKNFTWAGHITSQTRAILREAVIGNEKSIIAFSTDGIYSQKSLPVKASDKLGGWDVAQFDRGTILMSGVYLLEGEQTKTGERGYTKLSVSEWKGILEQLNEKKKAEVIVRFFIGFNMADNFPQEYGKHYLQFIEREKPINPHNLTKRKYQTRSIKDWSKQHCESDPINHLSGMSNAVKTEFDFLLEDDLIFTEDGNEILWILKE
jgi:hypothetical protein